MWRQYMWRQYIGWRRGLSALKAVVRRIRLRQTMVRFLVLKRLCTRSNERMEYQLLDRMSYKRFRSLTNAVNVRYTSIY